MTYARNTNGTTTIDGILDAVIDLGAGSNTSPYPGNASAVTLAGVLAALKDKVASSSSAPYARNTSGALLDKALDAAAGIAGGTSVAAFDPAVFGNITMAGIVAALTDLANASDSRPYPRNTNGTTTYDGVLDALTDIVAAGGLGGGGPPAYVLSLYDLSDFRNLMVL